MVKDKALEALYDLIIEAGSTPWVLTTIRIAGVVVLALLLFFIVKRVAKGDELSLFWLIKIKKTEIVEQQKIAFNNLNQDAKQKAQVIKILNQLSIETSKMLLTKSFEEFERMKSEVYGYILVSIGIVLTNQRSNSHRVAIFVNNGDGYLKISQGIGFSVEGKRELRLKIDESAAGNVYRTGEVYNSGDVESTGNMFKRLPKATKGIRSLICVPIRCDAITLGVLSIDGQDENSFTKDDEDYLKYFANALSPLMYIEYTRKKEGDTNEQDVGNEEQGQPA